MDTKWLEEVRHNWGVGTAFPQTVGVNNHHHHKVSGINPIPPTSPGVNNNNNKKQHQRPLFGPSFEGEARGDREPAAPMRAVEEMALGKILLGR